MARETGTWGWLKRARQRLHRLDLERIENSLGGGRPDVNGCFDGRTFDIELKRATMPRTGGIVRVKFRPLQPPWLTRRWNVGARCFVLLDVGVGPRKEAYLIPGAAADEMKEGRDIEWYLDRTQLTTRPREVTLEEVVAIAAWGLEGPRRLALNLKRGTSTVGD